MTNWTVLVPVRGGGRGKSRLPATIGGVARSRWVTAFAADTIVALRASDQVDGVLVVVSTTHPELAALVSADGAGLAPARLVQVTAEGLNASIVAVAAGLGGTPLAVFLGDLPSLTAADVGHTLTAAAAVGRAVVPDALGTGTVAIGSVDGSLEPRFGPGSLAAHVAVGHRPIPVADRVRRDVDTEADLLAALDLGVGPATAALAAEAGLVPIVR